MDYAIYILYIYILFCRSKVVSQFCDPDEEIIICQYQHCTLWCRPMSSIKIVSASYGVGRISKSKCSYTYENSVACSASTAMHIISTTCENKPSCTFEARNDVSGYHSCPYIYKYVNLSYTCTDKQESTLSTSEMTEELNTTSSTSKTTGFIVGLVVLSLIILICFFVLLYQRYTIFILKRKDAGRTMDFIINSNSPARDDTLSLSNNYQQSAAAYHQYSEISLSTSNPGTCAELPSCVPLLDYSSKRGNNMDDHELDGVDGVAANTSNFGFKSNVGDGAYFILDPKETGVNKSTELQREVSTESDSNEAKCGVTKSMDQTNLQGNLNDFITRKYGDSCEYNPVLNINHTKRRREELYDRVVDDVYDVSSHKKVIKDDDTYDHTNVVK